MIDFNNLTEVNKLIVASSITVGALIAPTVFILADLCAGIRKAKERGEQISSYGLRRTISKMAKYYNVLLALLVVDALQMSTIWYIDVYYQYNFILFPFFVVAASIGIGGIEIKSIYEKADSKVRRGVASVAKSVKDKKNLIAALLEYLEELDNN